MDKALPSGGRDSGFESRLGLGHHFAAGAGGEKKIAKKCLDRGSNTGPLDLQSNALPTELSKPVECHIKLRVLQTQKREKAKTRKKRDVLELNQRPIGLQPIALPLS